MNKFHEVCALYRLGKNKTEVARELGISIPTVRKYLQANTPPSYTPRAVPTKVDHFQKFSDFVRGKLELVPKLSAGEIYALIKPQGYLGSERTIQRRLESWREERPKERFFEQDYEPGEQSQFDFKESVELAFAEGSRIVHLHFGTLPFSDTCIIKGYPQRTFECFMDGVHSFFESLGGRTSNIRIDNLSPCVKRVRPDGGRDFTDAFIQATKYYGFGVLPCSPGKGNEKGDVERDIQTFARRFKNHVKVHGRVFRDFLDLNEELKVFALQERKPKVKELLEIETGQLLPLLPRSEEILCKVEETRASTHGTVRIAKTIYSVPDEWIGLELRVLAGAFEVQIKRPGDARAITHTRRPEGEHSIKLEHVLRSLVRKPQAMVRWAHREILFPDPVFSALYKRLKAKNYVSPGGAEREFLRVLNLIQYRALSEIKIALEIVLGSEVADVFSEVKDLLLIERRPEALIIDFRQVPLNPNLKDYDQLIPQQGAIG